MTQSFRLRPVNNANGAFESRLAQRIDRVGFAKIDHEPRQADFVKEIFVTATQRRSHVLSFRARAPVGCRGHCAVIRAESDENGFLAKTFANQLTDVKLTALTHLGGARITEMGIVRPDNCLRLATAI